MYMCMFLFIVSFTLKIAAKNRVDSGKCDKYTDSKRNTPHIVHWSVFTAIVITGAKQLLNMNC